MPKFLAGCHYNEEEISQHSKKKYRISAGPNQWQQVCNRSNPENTGRSCEGADFSLVELKSLPNLVVYIHNPKGLKLKERLLNELLNEQTLKREWF